MHKQQGKKRKNRKEKEKRKEWKPFTNINIYPFDCFSLLLYIMPTKELQIWIKLNLHKRDPLPPPFTKDRIKIDDTKIKTVNYFYPKKTSQIPLQMKFTCKLPKKLADPWSNPPTPPSNFRGEPKISGQNNWGGTWAKN